MLLSEDSEVVLTMQPIFFCSRHARTFELPRIVRTQRFDLLISKTKWIKNLLFVAKVNT